MGIFVAGRAVAVEAEPAPGAATAHGQRRGGRAPVPRRVAVGALGGGMAAVERPAGATVIEVRGISLGPGDQLEFPSGMIRVARRARRTAFSAVQAQPAAREPGHVLVTRETLCGHGTGTARLVACGALQGA